MRITLDIPLNQDERRGQLLLLAPPDLTDPGRFMNVSRDTNRHDRLLNRMQKFRGKLYVQDGAIQPHQLSVDGRHDQPADRKAWHLLLLNQNGEVYGCSRYLSHSNNVSFAELGVASCALAYSATWEECFRAAVESDIRLARNHGVAYAEVGGWALAPQLRKNSAEALRIVLGTYCLARTLGGCIGIGTVTVRHSASSILRRIGGRSLTAFGQELPRYFDAQYGCEMETLRFDSSSPSSRFGAAVQNLSAELLRMPVICREPLSSHVHKTANDPVHQHGAIGLPSPFQKAS